MKQDIGVVGIDIAKRIFHLVGMDARGQVILRKRLVRDEVLWFMANLPRVTVVDHKQEWPGPQTSAF